MKKENAPTAALGQPTSRITRARAAASHAPGGGLPPKPFTNQDQKRVLRGNSKRLASEENVSSAPLIAATQHKRRAVLKEVSNIFCDNSYRSCINAAKIQDRKQTSKGHAKKKFEVTPAISDEIQQTRDNAKRTKAEQTDTIEVAKSVTLPVNLEGNLPVEQSIGKSITGCDAAKAQSGKQMTAPLSKQSTVLKKEEDKFYENKGVPDFINIDSDHRDPLMCSLYAPDIYNNLRVAELLRRPSNFMETIQRDITQSMRGILVDWLVEVSEEYKLTPDTLYLTVYLIDRFLSQNYIERQRLQLLGITCMLIASKYEEICAPRVEEFCFITDNTYKRDEVLVMESQVLNYLGFQLAAPTIKSFLRRFLRAAQASYTAPSIELEFLANYIAELSLVEYEFIKILPSLIAASAVFLARWTLNQSCHPWNSTLEHYTRYKASDLKTTVTALQELHLNTKACPLNAIRDKYRQPKFKSVAYLLSSQLFPKLFQS